ncbi:hypothetical protein Tco_1078381 [Tanacetum coccineum]|uniref:Retrovirus-related Pol polyprotein from transposon TNT 1-94 n=1 Tax=Tanacetum coccineum TaxID=301880 RepID=A0ABQ5HNX2_9ASTR
MGLSYSKDSGFELNAYSDANHAGCSDDCKSTSRGIQFLGDKLVNWSSKKQDCIAMSTAKAEYVSLSTCYAQVIWMRTQLLDYEFRYKKIPMYSDSKSEIAISCNLVQHSRTKHINICYHFIKEHVECGTIELYFVRMKYQLADLFTKALPRKRFEYFVQRIVFHMAQQIILAAQLVSKFKGIRRCNNYDVLQSIPCSPECKIVRQILLDHLLSYALTTTADVPAVYLQQFWKTIRKVPDTKDTMRFKLDTQEITYMRVGYQGVVDKVSAFFMKNLAQSWETMFKVFNRCLTTRTFGHDQKKINILQLFHVVINRTNVDYADLLWWDFMNNVFQKKDVIQYPRFTKLIIADLMKKYPSISPKLDEDYHSIKDDILLFAASMIHDDVDDSGDRIETESHKEHPKVVDDDDDNKEEKKDEKESDEMGSLETRTKKMQTPISTTPRSPRINLSSDKNIAQELMYTVSLSTATTSKDPHKKRRISSKYSHLLGALHRMCMHQGYMTRDMEHKCVTTDEF